MANPTWEHLFRIHLNMLNRLTLDQRASMRSVGLSDLEVKYPKMAQLMSEFKSILARIIRAFNWRFKFIQIDAKSGAEIADLFDSSLFWKTFKQLSRSESISGDFFNSRVLTETETELQSTRLSDFFLF